VALFISGRDVATLPKRMFDAIRLNPDPVLAVASTLLFAMVLVGFAVMGMQRLIANRRAARSATP